MPFDQERRDYLNEKYPSAGHPRSYEKEFRDNTVDRQVDGLMNDALNLKRFNDNKLKVPSTEELRYRAGLPVKEPLITPEPLSEGLYKRDRPNPTPPTTPPPTADPPSSGPRTSPASPPPTPRTSGGGGSAIDMQVAPPTAAPRQSIGGPNPAPGAKPSGLPGPAGNLAYPAAGAAIDFAFRLGSGQPLGKAAAGAVGSGLGSTAGFAAGSALGPVGAFAGGMIGGYLGGFAGSALYDLAFPPTAEAPQDLSDPKTGPPPFKGGQCPISYGFVYTNTTGNFVRTKNEGIRVVGPIKSITTAVQLSGFSAPFNYAYYVIVQAEEAHSMENIGPKTWRHSMGYTNYGAAKFEGIEAYNPNNSFDSPLDNCGSPPPEPIPQDKRAPDSLGHPGNTNFAPPSAKPPSSVGGGPNPFSSSAPDLQPPNPAPNNYAPGGLKSKSGGNPRGDSPNWIPKGVPAPVPHPNYSPPPVAGLPGSAPSNSPSSTGAPAPNAAGNPNKSPFTFNPDGTLTIVSPGHPATTGNPVTNPADQSFPGSLQPNPLTAKTLSPGSNFSNSPSPDTGTPSGMPTTIINQPTPDAYRETPVVPAPTPTPTPTPTNQPDFDDFKKRFDEQALLLVGLTALLNPIANNTTPEALRNAAATGTCQTLQPGGCMAPLAKNAQDAANNSANNSSVLAGLMAFLQGLQATFLQPILAGVNLINTKLGPLMAGADGIGGFLSRLSKSLGIDRALNLIAIASNLHNAMMLSASLKVTLLEVLSSVGNATGLLQTSENENVDLNAVFNQGIESFMTTILGAENYAGLKVGLRKYNAIYRAATNSLNATAQMFNSIGEAIETASEYTGKIGNALRAASVVRENAYNFMAERFTVKTSRFMTFQSKVGDVTQVLETINEIAENVVEGQQQYTEALKATTDFKKALADADRPEAVDNKLIKAEAEKIKANLIKDPTGEDETGLLSFLTDR